MSGKSAYEAVCNFFEPIQLAISCVSPAVVRPGPGGYDIKKQTPHALICADNRPVDLAMKKIDAKPISMILAMEYRIVELPADPVLGPYKVSTTKYNFELFRDGHELFGFHYHPRSRIEWPHLHLPKNPAECSTDLAGLHIPTGRVALEEVILLALELGVKPRRDDAREVLARTLERHRTMRTWGGAGPPTAGL